MGQPMPWEDAPSTQATEPMPWEEDIVDPKMGGPRTPTYIESALTGAVEGIQPGLSAAGAGAISGGLKTLQGVGQSGDLNKFNDLLQNYRNARDQAQANVDFKLQSNPMSFRAAEGATSAFGVPVQMGTAATKGLMKLTPGILERLGPASAQVMQNTAPYAGAAVTGGMIGAGASRADLTKGEFGQAAEDTGVGAVLGSGLQKGMKMAGNALSGANLDGAAKKLAQIFFNTPPEVTQAYLDDPQRALNSPLRYQISKKFMDMVDNLQKMAQLGSSESRQILSEQNVKVNADEIKKAMKPLLDEIQTSAEGNLTGPRKEAYDYLKGVVDSFDKRARNVTSIPEPPMSDTMKQWMKENPSMIDSMAQYGALPAAPLPPSAPPPAIYSGNRLKTEIQDMQDYVKKWQPLPGQKTAPDDVLLQRGSGALNDLLKGKSPEYAEQMKQVAADTDLLKDASKLATSEGGLSNMFRRLTTDQAGAGQAPADTIKAFDQRMGSDFGDQARFAYAREMMDKGLTNGSRNVNLFSKMAESIPLVGKPLGAVAGATVDKMGGALTYNAVQAAAALKGIAREFGQTAPIQSVMKIKAVLGPIIAAVKQGNPSAIATLQLLQKSNPEAFQYLQNNPAQEPNP